MRLSRKAIIKPNQVLHYSCNDSSVGFQKLRDLFRHTVMEQLTANGSHESLHDFKHIVQVTKRDNRTEYRYELPADLPVGFIDGIRSVKLKHTIFGLRFKEVELTSTLTISKHEPCVLPFRPRTSKDLPETGIISAYRHFELHPEQDYLRTYLQKGIAQLTHFEQSSNSSIEKFRVLNSEKASGGTNRWSLDNVISAHYFDGPNGYIVLVGPRLRDVIRPEELIAYVTYTDRDHIKKSKLLPKEMSYGTCTPFAYRTTGRDMISNIVLLQLPERLMIQQADYSIGGHGPSAHRASIQMTPNTAKEILRSEFCEKLVFALHTCESYW